MDNKTAKLLNQINTGFYKQAQEYFNRSRKFSWAGWERLPGLLGEKTELQMLDIACGNGRLGKFLIKSMPKTKIKYWGMDNNQYLLRQARKAIAKAKLIKTDVLQPWKLGKEKFDLITIMGFLHHVAGLENRVKLLKQAKDRLRDNGLLVFTIWQFDASKRLSRKIVSWEEFKQKSKLKIDLKQLEKNDYILDWKSGMRGFRYCHLIDQTELKQLIKGLKMKLYAMFVDDSKEKIGNEYVVLEKV